jgi:hypothetical protein
MEALMLVLSDAQRRDLKPVLDQVRSGEGRRFENERRTVEAVIWRKRTWRPQGRGSATSSLRD